MLQTTNLLLEKKLEIETGNKIKSKLFDTSYVIFEKNDHQMWFIKFWIDVTEWPTKKIEMKKGRL